MQNKKRFTPTRILAVFIFIFGLVALKAGGSVLLSEAAQIAAGNYIPFIVWFNVLAAPFYLIIAVALWRKQECTHKLVTMLFLAHLVVDAFFIYHVQSGGLFEMRTVIAMSFRTILWGGVTLVLKRSTQPCDLADQTAG